MGSNTHDTLQSELEKREMIIVKREDKPGSVLSQLTSERCFIIGGGKTYSRFAPFLTHLYITPHPYIFGVGVRLFTDPITELPLRFQTMVAVDKDAGIYQYQYKVQIK